ncbi:MAG TPA: peptidase M14, partial [Flavobacterium sp.]
VPTILFEAGHFPEDYDREVTRKLILVSLVNSLNYIANTEVKGQRNDDYLNIPQNKIAFYDIVYRNVKINYDNREIITNFASHYKEELENGGIVLSAFIAEIGQLDGFHGHSEYDAAFQLYQDELNSVPQLEQRADFTLGNVKFNNGSPIK